jgi:hypothetical protein
MVGCLKLASLSFLTFSLRSFFKLLTLIQSVCRHILELQAHYQTLAHVSAEPEMMPEVFVKNMCDELEVPYEKVGHLVCTRGDF